MVWHAPLEQRFGNRTVGRLVYLKALASGPTVILDGDAQVPMKKTARSVRISHPTDLPTPRGLELRFCWQGRNQARRENELFHPESQGIRHKQSSFLAVGIQG